MGQVDNPMQICGAKTRSGNPCQNAPMENGRCRMHGGKAGRPIVHGRYSLKHRQALAEKQAEFLSDPRPADLTDELALMRALLQDYLERYEKQMPAEEIERVFRMVDHIARLVERVSKIVNQTALTQAEIILLQAVFLDVLNEFIPDPTKRSSAVDKLKQYIAIRIGATRESQAAEIIDG